jgi:hypothetical protein
MILIRSFRSSSRKCYLSPSTLYRSSCSCHSMMIDTRRYYKTSVNPPNSHSVVERKTLKHRMVFSSISSLTISSNTTQLVWPFHRFYEKWMKKLLMWISFGATNWKKTTSWRWNEIDIRFDRWKLSDRLHFRFRFLERYLSGHWRPLADERTSTIDMIGGSLFDKSLVFDLAMVLRIEQKKNANYRYLVSFFSLIKKNDARLFSLSLVARSNRSMFGAQKTNRSLSSCFHLDEL